MNKLCGIHAVLLWTVLVFVFSGCSTPKPEGATPSANELQVSFYTGSFAASGFLCRVIVPDHGNAPLCPAMLQALAENSCHTSEEGCRKEGKEYMPELGSIRFLLWFGFRVICFETARGEAALCVQGMLPEPNLFPRMIADIKKSVWEHPNILQPLEITIWNEELFGKITHITSWKLDQ
ncbi:hypothetical protein [Pseudomonas mosselii]|uniref:hypothetical protein n=1 Tax=Pseudomonas mosselii TaxID=78327 RepID=UPI001646D26B|nr:hypothetical protein [Pseudomonas mosselii]MBC3455097.1 hypothetical protein [Pseudomonas mosselii]